MSASTIASPWDLQVAGGDEDIDGDVMFEVCPVLPLYAGWDPADEDLPALRWAHGIACRLVLTYVDRVAQDGGSVEAGGVSDTNARRDLTDLDGRWPSVFVPWDKRKVWRARLEEGLVVLVSDALGVQS